MDKWLSRAGIAASIIYLIFLGFIVKDRWPEFLSLGLNEQGDFLAGVFGPLAFLWLVLGFFQQRIELKQNTEALQLQATEIRNSVEQQEELVKVTREQFKAELEAIQHERDQQYRSYQPIFTALNIGASHSPESSSYTINMKNIGQTASSIQISISREMKGVTPREIPSWESGELRSITLSYINSVPEEHTVLTIHYIDVMGMHGSIAYDVIPNLTQQHASIKVQKCSS